MCYADGTPISASTVTDKFANVEFGAMGGTSAAMMLHRMINARVRLAGRVPGLRVAADVRRRPRQPDATWKRPTPAAAARWSWPSAGTSGVMVSIVRESSEPYRWSLGTAPLADVALGAKPMPDEFINAAVNGVTAACLDYLRPLVGALPEYVRLA